MTQVVGYYDNDVTFTEGPFVLCNPRGGGWRVEVELKTHKCPVLPDRSIYLLTLAQGLMSEKTHDFEKASKVCDWLNDQVHNGKIVLDGNCWVTKVTRR